MYLSAATGEVVQYTTTASRVGAYVGAIPHWLYFTPLRKHQPQWSTFVIWSSGAGAVSALAESVAATLSRVTVLQLGRIQVYLLYILITLIVVLAWWMPR